MKFEVELVGNDKVAFEATSVEEALKLINRNPDAAKLIIDLKGEK